ncbi:zinc ribbon domain-containing protein [Pseudogemmobacter bohemicus]|uniref:hypothetical protein n=1 Tax=Pseudogemmobacter bohemicus TaxID=2250708 RepID=UPI00130025B8
MPDNAIPEAGRDVQCSNCGHAWFQLPVDPVAEEPVEEAYTPVSVAADSDGGDAVRTVSAVKEERATPDTSARISGHVTEKEPEIIREPEDPEEQDLVVAAIGDVIADAEEAAPAAADLTGTDALKAALIGKAPPPEPVQAPPPVAEPVRRELDEAVLSILRDEAEREASVRKAEAQRSTNRRAEADTGLQSQPELSMPAPTAEQTAQQKRLAMLRGEDLDEPDPEPSRPMARRDLLPDVEEINSTLQPDESRFDLDSEVDSLPDLTRGGFRTGFLLAMLALIIAALIYVFSDRIIASIPAAESALQAYVGFIDNLRSWLNSLMDQATQAMTGDTGSGG